MDNEKDRTVVPFMRPAARVVICDDEEYATATSTEPTLDDLAFIAERLMVTHINSIDWAKLKAKAEALCDETDAATVVKFMENATVKVEVPS